jgi:hypothetical protein
MVHRQLRSSDRQCDALAASRRWCFPNRDSHGSNALSVTRPPVQQNLRNRRCYWYTVRRARSAARRSVHEPRFAPERAQDRRGADPAFGGTFAVVLARFAVAYRAPSTQSVLPHSCRWPRRKRTRTCRSVLAGSARRSSLGMRVRYIAVVRGSSSSGALPRLVTLFLGRRLVVCGRLHARGGTR